MKRSLLICASVVGFVFFGLPAIAGAATIYINSSTGNDTTGNGSFGTPYKTFHKGYASSTSGDILDLTGTFTWTDADETGDAQYVGYNLAKNLTITGQGADTTYIQAASNASSGDRRIFTVKNGSTVTIKNLTIRYGRNATSFSGTDGGGIYVEAGGTLTAEDCRITENYVSSTSWGGFGGGINNAGTLTVNRCTVDNNFAYSQGGGINNAYTAGNTNVAYITNSTIAFNSTAATVATVGGAGHYVRSDTSYVTNTTIAYNDAPDGTGDTTGIDVVSGATLNIKNSIVAKNEVGGVNVNTTSGNFFDITNSGTLNDRGGNIFGKVNTAYSGVTFSGTSWYDLYGNGAGNNIFTLSGSSTTGTLDLSTSLAVNSAENNTQTLVLTGTSSVAINNGQSSANVSVSIPTTDQRGAERNGATDIGSYEYGGTLGDTIAPIISSVDAESASSTTTISWSTDEASSSLVTYGPTSSYGTSTPEEDTSPRVTSHEVELSGLEECTLYHYRVVSEDASGNSATSSDNTFLTEGCTGNSTVASSEVETITVASGGSLEAEALTLGIPSGAVSGASSVVFQAHELEPESFFTSAGTPSGKIRAGESVFALRALRDANTSVSSFDADITVSIEYEAEDIVGINESSLWIHRYDGSTWHALSSCTVNTSSRVVSCTTDEFSDFALFGEGVTQNTSTSGGQLIKPNKPKETREVIHDEVSSADDDSDTAEIVSEQIDPIESVVSDPLYDFTRDLTVGATGDDVRALQELLISENKGVNAQELARIGATGFFGTYTKNALGEFQQAVGIAPHAGYFGPITRAYLATQ